MSFSAFKSPHRGRSWPMPKRTCRPSLEVLEDRAVPATFTVTNLADDGAGSLRQAIAAANGFGDADVIVFQPGLTGTITLTSGQLNVTKPVTITGPGSGALTISGNNASRLFLVNNGSTAIHTFAMSGMTLTNGLATGSFEGGGIDVGSEDLTLSDMNITGNSAQRGGGINLGLNGRLTLVNSSVSSNKATANNGGGLYLDDNTLTVIRNSTIAGNTTVLSGAGINLGQGGFLAVEGSTIAGNQTPFSGGGIIGQTGANTTLVVRNSTVAGNTANDGGGILMGGEGSLTVENSTISGNKANRDGGGLWLNGVTFGTVRNSTIAFNTADNDNAGGGQGGGIYIFDAVPATPFVTLQSNIVAENLRGSAGPREDIFGTVRAASRLNIVGVDTGLAGIANGVNGNQVGTGAVPLNPMLAPLANNGGTTLTHALLEGSPALNAGFNFSGQASDQRGGSFSRSVGVTDIGAFEVQPPPPPPPAPPAPTPSPVPVVEIKVKRVLGRTRVEVLVDGAVRRRFFPFGAFKGSVKVQRLDVNGDGLLDVIARATIGGRKRTRTFVT